MAPNRTLLERCGAGEKIVCAEGYLFNFERRGYLQAGPFVPTVVLDHPELVKSLHEEFVNAGSDVVQAFTYYAHREKLALINRADDLEKINRTALQIARDVARKTDTLFAGNICNVNDHKLSDPVNRERIKGIFKEQIDLLCEEGADFIIAETFFLFEEAMVAMEAINEFGKGIPSVVTMAGHLRTDETGKTVTADNVEITEAMKRLESEGASVVGINCMSGPETTLGYMEKIKKSGVTVPLACVPVPYRTTPEAPSFFQLKDPLTGKHVFPVDLDCCLSSRSDIHKFGRRCDELGITYIGLCCGNAAHFTRTLCESIGRTPPASMFSPRLDLHAFFGTDEKVVKNHTDETKDYIISQNGDRVGCRPESVQGD